MSRVMTMNKITEQELIDEAANHNEGYLMTPKDAAEAIRRIDYYAVKYPVITLQNLINIVIAELEPGQF